MRSRSESNGRIVATGLPHRRTSAHPVAGGGIDADSYIGSQARTAHAVAEGKLERIQDSTRSISPLRCCSRKNKWSHFGQCSNVTLRCRAVLPNVE
jgi:hypothetical protein